MKKLLSYLSLALTGLLMAACSEDFKDWATQQTYPQEAAITIPGFTASATGAVDLNSVESSTQLLTLSQAALPEGYTIQSIRMDVSPAEGGDPVTIEANANGDFSKAELQELIEQAYGKRPVNRLFNAHVYASAVRNGQAALIDAGTIQLNLTPEAPQISENYYLVGGTQDWAESAINKTQKFQHSGADVYEDPIFTIIINAAEGDTWFAIGDDAACEAIADGDWSKLLGNTDGNGKNGLTGTLDFRYNLPDDGSLMVPAGNKLIKVTLNMMDYTFQIEPLNISENYYIVGGPNDWQKSAAEKTLKFSHSDKSVFDDPEFTIVFDASEGDTWFAIGDDEACDAIANDGDWSKLFGTTKGNGNTDLSGTFDRRYNLADEGSFCVPAGSKKIKVRINMMDYTYEITPVNVADAYYLVGGPLDWAASAASKEQKFSHSNLSVADDPVFTYILESTGSEMWFAIGDDEACDAITNDGNWSKLYGSTSGNGTSGLSGSLDRRTSLSDDGSFMLDGAAKYYRIQINMSELTYNITPLNFAEYYYEIGNESGWSTSHPLFGAGDGKYQGFYWLDGEYKFKPNADNWENDLEYVSGDALSGTLHADGGPNCPDPGAGFYRIDLDAAAMTYSLLKIESISMIGGFNGWNDDLEMAYNVNEGCWEVTTDAVSGEYKFRGNHDWGINWGGSVDNLTQDGSNLSIEAGTYKFQLYISYQGNNKVVITKQ